MLLLISGWEELYSVANGSEKYLRDYFYVPLKLTKILKQLKPHWDNKVSSTIGEKFLIIDDSFSLLPVLH